MLTPWLNSTRMLELACIGVFGMRHHRVLPTPLMKVKKEWRVIRVGDIISGHPMGCNWTVVHVCFIYGDPHAALLC